MSSIRIEKLTKTFRDFWGRPKVTAVRDLDLEVRRGEIFGLLGPNGAGKSTTIKILLGLLKPSSGRVAVLGSAPGAVEHKRRLGYGPEESRLYPFLTAAEALDFYARLFGLAAPERRRRVELWLERVGLTHARNRRVGEFSKGMGRRLVLAQALINDPELVILDEPTSGLDPLGTREVRKLLLELKERGTTVLLSSHLLADVESVCDRVAILDRGVLRACGPIEEVLADDRRTQIVTDRLGEETVREILEVIARREGPDCKVEVGRPSTRLEDFFVRVVRPDGDGGGGKDGPS